MAFDLLLDQTTNDLVFKNYDFCFTETDPVEIGQRVAMKLRTFQGEWFLDIDYGIPYVQSIISQARSQKEVDAIFIQQILAEDGVNSIIDFSSTFSSYDRVYTATTTISTTAGDITIAINKDPSAQFTYPTPSTDSPRASCGISDIITLINELYEYINYTGLPAGGTGTWINNWA